jgi:putative hydrolase of the HAD superfamily
VRGGAQGSFVLTGMYRGIIFDLFHTLTGMESRWSEHPSTCSLLGIDKTAWNHALWEQSRWRLIGEELDAVTIIRRLAHSIDPDVPLERIEDATHRRIDRFRHALRDIPVENVQTLQTLRAAGVRLALVSNADVIEIAGWSESPLAELFDTQLFSCFVGCAKPDLEIYQRCLRELDLTAAECLFVGDGGSNELVGAREAGLTTVLMSGVVAELWPEKIPSRLPSADYHIRAIPEVLGLIQRGQNVDAGDP